MPERIAPVTIDYAAIAADMPTVEKPTEPAAAPRTNDPATPATPAALKVEPAEGAPAEKLPPEAEAPFKKGFDQLVKGQAELRAQRDALKPFEGLSKAVSPVQASALVKALASGDPLAAMTALGFSYADVSARVAGGAAKPSEKPAAAESEKPTAESADPELVEMKRAWKAQQAQQAQQTILDSIKTAVTGAGEKFKTISGLEDFEGVRRVIDEMWVASHPDPRQRFLPSENGLENIAIAAEEYERRLAAGEVTLTKKQWEKLASLTAAPGSGSTAARPPENRPGTAPVSAAKSLTNKTAAPPAPVAPRPSEPDYAALARELP
jgi:hypothetical protein